MSRRRHDTRTLDLLDWQPPEGIAPAFAPEAIRAVTLRAKVARAVSATLNGSEIARDVIAQRMSDFLGEDVSKASIDQYASQAREDQTISALRLMALAHATGDMRPLQLLVEPLGYAIIQERYLGAVEAELIGEKMNELADRQKTARRLWKGGRR